MWLTCIIRLLECITRQLCSMEEQSSHKSTFTIWVCYPNISVFWCHACVMECLTINITIILQTFKCKLVCNVSTRLMFLTRPHNNFQVPSGDRNCQEIGIFRLRVWYLLSLTFLDCFGAVYNDCFTKTWQGSCCNLTVKVLADLYKLASTVGLPNML